MTRCCPCGSHASRYPLTVIREPEQFDEYFNQHKEGNLYCLFTGAIEESTGKSWYFSFNLFLFEPHSYASLL